MAQYTYLDRIQADLSRLSQQLDCRHTFFTAGDYKACEACSYKYEFCKTCGFPSLQGDCDWCK